MSNSAVRPNNLFFRRAKIDAGSSGTSEKALREVLEASYRSSWPGRLNHLRKLEEQEGKVIEHNPGGFVGRVITLTDSLGEEYFVGIFRRIMVSPDEKDPSQHIGDLSVRISFDSDNFDDMHEAFRFNEDSHVGDVWFDPDVQAFWEAKLQHAEEIITQVEAELGLSDGL